MTGETDGGETELSDALPQSLFDLIILSKLLLVHHVLRIDINGSNLLGS